LQKRLEFRVKLNKMKKILSFLGISIQTGYSNLKSLRWYLRDYNKLKKQLFGRADFPFSKPFPILHEKYDDGGITNGHYFHQDLLVAQKIFINKPLKHVDVGSRTDGFVAHIAAFREIEVFDIRTLNVQIDNIKFVQADFMKQDTALGLYTDSISCLHAIEHFGLGRYNDTIDADGHIRGLNTIYHTLKQGGKFYFSTPIGPQRIEFNAHRVFSIQYLLHLFKGKYSIDSFSFIDDSGDLYKDIELTKAMIESNCGCTYGCCVFELTKI
jgi:SAM-dependent methyltransferase